MGHISLCEMAFFFNKPKGAVLRVLFEGIKEMSV